MARLARMSIHALLFVSCALFPALGARGADARLSALQFTSDHKLLRHNTKDILAGGDRCPDVHWRPGVNAPITHTGGDQSYLRAALTFSLAGNADEVPFELRGNSAEPALCFRAAGRLTTGKQTTVAMTALQPLGKTVRKINRTIAWSLTLHPDKPGSSTIDLGHTGPHVVYVTLGTPRPSDDPVSLITDSRMELAVERVAAAIAVQGESAAPPWIVYELMKQNGAHYLPTRHYSRASAWKLPESWRMNPPGASCISIVEFVRLLGDTIGLEGTLRMTAFYADADNPRMARRGGLGDPPITKTGPNHEKWQLFLVDQTNTRHGQRGGVGGMNYYEATLEYDLRGKKYFYPGGTDRVYDTPEKVLTIFRSLVWATWDDHVQDWVVRNVVHTYVQPGEKYPPSVPLPR